MQHDPALVGQPVKQCADEALALVTLGDGLALPLDGGGLGKQPIGFRAHQPRPLGATLEPPLPRFGRSHDKVDRPAER